MIVGDNYRVQGVDIRSTDAPVVIEETISEQEEGP